MGRPDVIILVGGQGTRLRPLTYDIPKPLLPLGDRPIIDYIIDNVKEVGDRIIFACGYKSDELVGHLKGMAEEHGIDTEVIIERRPKGTGGAIKYAYRKAECDGKVVVLNGDIITSARLDKMLSVHEDKEAAGTIALWPVKDSRPFGALKVDENGFITEFKEKPPEGNRFSDKINAGIYVLERDVIDMTPKGVVSIERDVFPEAIKKGKSIASFPVEGYWFDVGTPENLLRAQGAILERYKPKLSHFFRDVKVKPPVYVEKCNIGNGTTLGPNVSVYKGAYVGKDCHLSNAIIFPSANLGRGVRIDGGIVSKKADIRDKTRINDWKIHE